MKKTIFILLITLFSFSSLNADYLLENKNICISDYWYSYNADTAKNTFYYIKSDNPNHTYYSATTKFQRYIYPGFVYDNNTSICSSPMYLKQLGLNYYDFNFLLSMSGLVFGFMLVYMFFVIPLTKKG